ncbi:uncharacterized protein LOC125193683 isoform X2 [Salvia hispanica]|uniref:uncharacterized protein LOC125193683 isoform X2 n=1 Tax=Salvia hispanica TaxID=49212 RepID=UPI002009595F|nr:uncharacterized protein LOC125193683 isoform X2 [Salvia hispanica]
MSKCTTQKVKKPLSLNLLHAISISKQTEATKRSKLTGGTVGSKDVDKESSAKKTTGCGVEHEKNSSDRIPESDKSTNNEDVFGKQTVEDTTVKKTNNKGTSCMSGGEKSKVTMKNVSLDQVSGKEIVEQTITKDIVGEKIDGDMAVGEASEKGCSGVSGTKRPREDVLDRTASPMSKISEKRGKGKVVVHNDTSENVVAPGVKKGKKKKEFETMKLKISPTYIIEVMQSLNERQRAAVDEMGFGQLIHFGITEIPGKMAYDLLLAFNNVTCTLALNSQPLQIFPEDVYVTLGLSIGGTVIRRVIRQTKQPFMDEVARRVCKERTQMVPDDLINEMHTDKSGGEWFRKLFVLIVDTVLIGPCGDGRCRTQIAHIYDDISIVKDYNWCAYTLDSLVVGHKNWNKNKKNPFSGPAAFLVAFYVDRVFHQTLLVSRVFPTVSGWTSELLRIRQKMEVQTGCIGRGSVIERGDPEKLPRPTKIVVLEVEDKIVENPLSKAMVALAEAEEEATKAIQSLLNRINDAAALIENIESFRIAATTAYKMLGVVPKNGNEDEDTLENLKQALTKEELDTPEILVVVANMMKVTNVLKKMAEVGPTFDIGFSFGRNNDQTGNDIVMYQAQDTNKEDNIIDHDALNGEEIKCISDPTTFTTIGMNQNTDDTKSFLSIGCSARPGVGTKDASNVEEIVKSAIEAFMECGDDDDDVVCLASMVNNSVTRFGNQIVSTRIDKGKAILVEPEVKNPVDAPMDFEDNEADFVTPFSKKPKPKMCNELGICDTDNPKDDAENWKLKVRARAEMKLSDAMRSPYYERAGVWCPLHSGRLVQINKSDTDLFDRLCD